MQTALRLEPVTRDNVWAACQLTVRPGQDDVVAPVSWSLAQAYTMPDVAWPRLIYDADQLVGFIMAAFAPDHESALYHSFLWRLNVGAEHQGKGYGRFAVEALCEEALRRDQPRLVVSYHQHGPEGFYRRLGFRVTGEHIFDEIVAERILCSGPAAGQAGQESRRRAASVPPSLA